MNSLQVRCPSSAPAYAPPMHNFSVGKAKNTFTGDSFFFFGSLGCDSFLMKFCQLLVVCLEYCTVVSHCNLCFAQQRELL